jgi:hypothetical protein
MSIRMPRPADRGRHSSCSGSGGRAEPTPPCERLHGWLSRSALGRGRCRITTPPILDWFHIAMRLQHAVQSAIDQNVPGLRLQQPGDHAQCSMARSARDSANCFSHTPTKRTVRQGRSGDHGPISLLPTPNPPAVFASFCSSVRDRTTDASFPQSPSPSLVRVPTQRTR